MIVGFLVILLTFFGLPIFAVGLHFILHHRAWRRRKLLAAINQRLELAPKRFVMIATNWSGDVEGFRVRTEYNPGLGEYFSLRVEAYLHVPGEIFVARGTGESFTGDHEFDGEMRLMGRALILSAALDVIARRSLLTVARRVRVEHGVIGVVLEGAPEQDAIEETLQVMIALAKNLSFEEGDAVRRLVETIEIEINKSALCRQLDVFFTQPAEFSWVERAVKVALKSVEPSVHVRVAVHARATAQEVLGEARTDELLILGLTLPEEEIVIASANALEKWGTIAAVEPLLRRSEGKESSMRIKAAAREAIGSIQERAGAGGRGQVSILELDQKAGALSQPAAGGGELSAPSESSD